MKLGMCKIVVKNGVAELDENTVKELLSISGAYAMSKVLPDDWKEHCRKNNINPDGVLDLLRNVVGVSASMFYGLIYNTDNATKELADEIGCSIEKGNEDEYTEWKKDEKIFDGGEC